MSLNEAGQGKVAFDVTPTSALGAIWAPGGTSIDAAGNVYVATGNPDPSPGNFGESVLKFDNTAAMHRIGAFETHPGGDNDISSVSPAILPGNMLFQIGKQQTGFLVDTNTMTQLQALHMCDGVVADGADAFDGSHLFVPCQNHIQEVNVDLAHRTMSLGWVGPAAGAAGSPILAAGNLWTIDRTTGTLYALSPATGAVRATFAVGAVAHFAAPAAALGLVVVPTLSGITALAGPSGVPPRAPSTCVAQMDHNGYWLAGTDGNLYAFGSAPNCGSLAGIPLTQPVVGMAGRSTAGYWMVARDGGIFAFGTATFHGSMGGRHLNQPIVGMTPTPTGNGYWLVASDGGMFSFGDARFFGSMGGQHLNQPIVGMTATPSGRGYWLVARDGGIFSFGDARFFGSMGALHLNQPMVGMAPSPTGQGYWTVAGDGGIFSFGNAAFRGSTGNLRLVVAHRRHGGTERGLPVRRGRRRDLHVRVAVRRIGRRSDRRRAGRGHGPRLSAPRAAGIGRSPTGRSAEGVARRRGRGSDAPEPVRSVLEQLARRRDRRAQRDEAEAAPHGDPPDTDGRELGHRRRPGEREHVDREVDLGHERADVVEVLHPGRVEHVGAGRLVRLEARDRVREIRRARAGSSRRGR